MAHTVVMPHVVLHLVPHELRLVPEAPSASQIHGIFKQWASGIMRPDNSWLFVIGDELTFWIFSTKYLRLLKDRYKQKTTPTSVGHLMPIPDADRYCLRKITSGESVNG